MRSSRRLKAVRATEQDEGSTSGSDDAKVDQLKSKFFPTPGSRPEIEEEQQEDKSRGSEVPSLVDAVNPIALGRQARKAFDQSTASFPSPSLIPTMTTDAPGGNANPINLGRQARKAFDEVWNQLSSLASPTKSYIFDDEVEAMGRQESDIPQAATTTVLVLGATGRVGRILTRKLLLRGYKVRAMIRKRDGRGGASPSPSSSTSESNGATPSYSPSSPSSEVTVEGVPPAVKIVFGDVGEIKDCQEAVKGVNKVIYCASARSTFTGELLRVEESGVRNIAKAFQDEAWRQAASDLGEPGVAYAPLYLKKPFSNPSRFAAVKRKDGVQKKLPIFADHSKRELADFSKKYHQSR